MNFVRIAGLTGAAIALVGGVTVAATSCSQTPVNVPVRTFQQAQKVDIVCMAVNDANGNPLPATELKPLPQDSCSPVPTGGNPVTFPNHLYAAVTQTTPGTLAVVDLTNGGEINQTSGGVIDEDNTTPGINFIPVGALPTDVAIPPDGSMTFVTSAAPDKFAIYGIDNRHLLGTSTGNPTFPPLALSDLPVCALPQAPDALSIAPLPDGRFVLLVMLRATGNGAARIAAYDPGPLLRGAHVPSASAGDGGAEAGPADAPGQLQACALLGNTLLADSSSLPSSFQAGPAWPDGVPYVEGGVDAGPTPQLAPVLEGGVSVCSAGPISDGGVAWPALPPTAALPAAMVLRTDKSLLYVADGALPLIHVIDVSDPTSPREQAPLLATSVRNPGHVITVGPLAISPATRDYKRYLYAVDESDGTIMVYDVTDPVTSPRVPMQRPHAELNPFVPADRLSFSSPVATVSFVEHDWLLPSQADSQHYYSGILCNPNHNAYPAQGKFAAKGAYYRVDNALNIQNSGAVENFPTRLRGIFGFVTLTNGSIIAIDVDDWDAPCRRPDPMGADPGKNSLYGDGAQTGVLDIAQTLGPTGDLDEYHVPIAYNDAIPNAVSVTMESFFPVSAPNRMRSLSLLENDPSGGNHAPYVQSAPALVDVNGSPVAIGDRTAPLLLPPPLDPGFVDPTVVSNPTEPNPLNRTVLSQGASGDAGVSGASGVSGVRVAFDDPTAHVDQDWVVTFEGALPTLPGSPLDVTTTDDYRTLTLGTGVTLPDGGTDAGAPANGLSTPGFCGMGIEDWSIGSARAQAAGLPASAAWTSDYIEIADDLLLQDDPYWGEPEACWSGSAQLSTAQQRYSACSQLFGAQGTDAGASGNGTLADSYLSRDFPIIQAFDDHLVVGRFGWNKSAAGEQTTNRVVVGADASNVPFLKLAQCCFHNQATIKVRTGGEWVAVAQNGIGLIHHVQSGPGGACTLSCNPADALKNARELDLSVPSGGKQDCTILAGPVPASRNDPRALRNPMFSFYIRSPESTKTVACDVHTLVQRDDAWQFKMRGGFNPISISLAQGGAAGVSPRSMRFIEPFGQLAVVDGSQQGLVVIDLNTLGFAHNPYY